MLLYRALIIAAVVAVGPTTLSDATAVDSNKRFLRGDDDTHSFSFETADDKERIGPIDSLKFSKTFKSLHRSVSRATTSLNEKLVLAMPIRSKLKFWNEHNKPIAYVAKKLGMDTLTGEAFKTAENFKYYDDYAMAQIPKWTKEELTVSDVIAELGLPRLLSSEFTTSPNYKYYNEYMTIQVRIWSNNNLDADTVLLRLGLNTFAAAARKEAVNYIYYDAFMVDRIRVWLKNDVPYDEILAKLSLKDLTGTALVDHPNYMYYKFFVKSKLKSWAVQIVPLKEVNVLLGLDQLRGQALTTHPNYPFYLKFKGAADKYRNNGWLKERRTTYDVWTGFHLTRLASIRSTTFRNFGSYEMYKQYVNTLDDYIIGLMANSATIPNLIKNVDAVELRVKTQIWAAAERPDYYVKFSLGLSGLDDVALKEAPNYQFYDEYLKGVEIIKKNKPMRAANEE